MVDSAKPFYWTERDAWYYYEQRPNGKRGRVYLADSKREAMKLWKARLASMPKAATKERATFRFVSAKWLERQVQRRDRGEVGAKWVTRVARTIKAFDSAHPKVMCFEITPAMCRRWIGADASASYEHTELTVLKQILKWAVEEGQYLSASPLATMKLEKGSRRESVISLDQHRNLVRYADRKRFIWSIEKNGLRVPMPDKQKDQSSLRAMLWFLWWTGARPGELRQLDWSHVSADCSTAVLREHKTAKSTGRSRVIYFNPLAAQILQRHRKENGPVFTTSRGNRWSSGELGRRFRRLKELTGVEVTPYTYRHAFITRALLAGADVGLVAELTGTSIEMISRHYSHIDKAKPHLAGLASRLR